MSTNDLPLLDSDLDLVTQALELHYMRGLTDSAVPLADLQRMHVLTEQLWEVQKQRDKAQAEELAQLRKQTT